MKLQGRTLSLRMQGEDVKVLQSELGLLGFRISAQELKRAIFQDGTLQAVVTFQRLHAKDRLRSDGIVDEATARLINVAVDALPPPAPTPAPAPVPSPVPAPNPNQPPAPSGDTGAARFVVRGTVLWGDDTPVSSGNVHVFDRDMRSRDDLGSAPIKEDGRFELPYGAEQFARAEFGSADLAFEVSNPEGLPLKVTTLRSLDPVFPTTLDGIYFNAPEVATVELRVEGTPPNRLSEYERLVALLTPIMQGVAPADLTTEDLSFLTGETELPRAILDIFATSARLSRQFDFRIEVFYGLGRERVPLDQQTLALQSPATLVSALTSAIGDAIIPSQLGELAATLAQRLHLALTARALAEPPTPRAAPLSAFLARAIPDAGLQQRFLSLYVQHEGPIEEFWSGLRQDPSLGTPGTVDKIQRQLQLAVLTGNHLPLVNRLNLLEGNGQLATLRDLARLETGDWVAMLKAGGADAIAAIPEDVSGATDAERIANFAQELAGEVARVFPTAVIARELIKQDAASVAGTFIFAQPDFEFDQVHIDSYVAANPAAFPAEPAARASLVGDLKQMQRVFTLTPVQAEFQVLLDAGIPSARAIVRMGASGFAARFGATLGADRAEAIHRRAQQISRAAAIAFARYSPAMNSVEMAVTRRPT